MFVGFYDGCWINIGCEVSYSYSIYRKRKSIASTGLFSLFSVYVQIFFNFSHYTSHTPILHLVRLDREKNTSTLHPLWWGRISLSLSLSLILSVYSNFMMFSNKFLSLFRKHVYILCYKLARSSESKHTSD